MMTKATRIGLIISFALILVGGILFGTAVHMLKGDFSQLSTGQYETNEYLPSGEYTDISIDTDTAGIEFILAEGAGTKVVCYEQTKAKHTVTVENGTLTIRVTNEKKWYDYIGFHFDTPKITVYLPGREYGNLTVRSDTGAVQLPGDLSFGQMDVQLSTGMVKCNASVSGAMKIKTTTGSITLEKLSAGSVELSASTGRIIGLDIDCQGDLTVNISTGKVGLTNVKCQNLVSNGSTGDMSLENVIASGAFNIKRDTGDVEFEKCDASEITVVTDTGHIRGSLLTDKVFIAQTDTGRVEVPHTATGGKCELTTDTGNIKIELS